MSDVAEGAGWWQASDGKWYPPESLAESMVQQPEQPEQPAAPAEPAWAMPTISGTAGGGSPYSEAAPTPTPYAGTGAAFGAGAEAPYPEAGSPYSGAGSPYAGAGSPYAGGTPYPGASSPYAGAGSPGSPYAGGAPYPGATSPYAGAGSYPIAPGYPAYVAVSSQAGNPQSTVVAVLLVLLGVAGLIWGIGDLFSAIGVSSVSLYPRDEQIGAWIVTTGILLASLVTIGIGLVHHHRR